MGLPGSGKSYFANTLAKRLGADYFKSDEIRKQLDLRGKYTKKDKFLVYRELFDQAKTAIKDGKSVVLDATFYLREMRGLFFRLAKRKKIACNAFLIQAEEQLILERLDRPRTDSEAGVKVYRKIKEIFDPVEEPHLKIESTDSNIEEMIQRAISYIKWGYV